jgi:anti-sigma B factor antagonist
VAKATLRVDSGGTTEVVPFPGLAGVTLPSTSLPEAQIPTPLLQTGRILYKKVRMETAIGVFASRDRAEDAVKQLLSQQVPEPSIVFLTPAEDDAHAGNGAAASPQSSQKIATSLMSVPGIGRVFALGLGAASLLGLAGSASASGAKASPATQPTPNEKCSDDIAFFRDALKEGRSLVVVRTDSSEIAKAAGRTLDRLGLGLRPLSPGKMRLSTRQVESITIVDICGRITHGEGNVRLRELVDDLLIKDKKKILLNLGEVHYVDSSGMGELVRIYTSIRNQGGQVRLVNLSGRVHGLLQMTRLLTVFQIEQNEAAGIASLSQASQGVA